MTGQLVLLCGGSFPGKSTVASFLADSLPGYIVSLDAINEERGLYGGEGFRSQSGLGPTSWLGNGLRPG